MSASNKSNKYKTSLIYICLSLVFCLLLIFSALLIAAPHVFQAADEGYLLDRVIKWADGTTEHVQIDNTGFFYLNGQKKHLVGMMISNQNPTNPRYWAFWEAENLAYVDKQLSYLEAAGIRLVRTQFPYYYSYKTNENDEAVAYEKYLDLFYEHKMLVIIGPHAIDLGGSNNLEAPDFDMGYGDTVGQWAIRLTAVVNLYPNIVAINAENELDYKLTYHTYTAANVNAYLSFLTNIFRQNTKAVITHNLMDNQIEPEIKRVCLNLVDIPSVDCYRTSPESLDKNLAAYLPSFGIIDGWWCMEIGYLPEESDQKWIMDTSKVTPEFIDAVFTRGARIAVLFWATDNSRPNCTYFDNNAEPKPNLIAIVKEVPRLQTPVEQVVSILTAIQPKPNLMPIAKGVLRLQTPVEQVVRVSDAVETSKQTITVRLVDSAGKGLTDGKIEYYSNGWKTIGTTSSNGELSYNFTEKQRIFTFRCNFAGAIQNNSQNVATNPVVIFRTTKVSTRLIDSSNNDLPGGSVQYYANGWKTFGDGGATTSMELLPSTYTFRCSFDGAFQDKSMYTTNNITVIFQTGSVHSDSGACTSYHASGWKSFSQDMKLLPGTYTFRFKDGTADTRYIIVENSVNHIH